jgi:hypothetical protein
MKTGLIAAAGLFDLLAALFHLGFWRIFRWPKTLAGAGRLNAATAQVLNIMLTYVFVLMGMGLLWFGAATPAFPLLAGAGFFAFRACLQPLFYGLMHPASKAIFALALLGALLHAIPALISA